jgi:hypothetical protein
MTPDVLKGWLHSERGSHSVRTGAGHRRPVPELAVTQMVVYPTAHPDQRKVLTLGPGGEYTQTQSGEEIARG